MPPRKSSLDTRPRTPSPKSRRRRISCRIPSVNDADASPRGAEQENADENEENVERSASEERAGPGGVAKCGEELSAGQVEGECDRADAKNVLNSHLAEFLTATAGGAKAKGPKAASVDPDPTQRPRYRAHAHAHSQVRGKYRDPAPALTALNGMADSTSTSAGGSAAPHPQQSEKDRDGRTARPLPSPSSERPNILPGAGVTRTGHM